MLRLIYNKKALTLIEVLVTVSILTLVFGMTFGAMRIYDISISMGNSKSYLSAQVTQALNKMSTELAESNVSQATITNNASPTPDEALLRIPNGIDANGNIIWGDGQTANYRIRYYIGNVSKPNQLIRQVQDAGGTPQSQTVLANDVTNLQFTLSGNSLTIDVTANKPIQRGIVPALSVTMSTRVDFKN